MSSFLAPQWGLFVNFLSASRKGLLIPSGYFSPNQDISWIWNIPIPIVNGNPVSLLGTLDGINTVFTTPSAIVNGVTVFRNGVLQQPGVMFNVVGNSNIVFIPPYIPQPGDYLLAVLGNIGYSPAPVFNAATPITPTGSPFVYTAGQTQETILISGGAVELITMAGTQITQSLPCTVVLQPTEVIVVTYTVAPLMVKLT
jgi:hypothetical protein